ncbi:MFS transporter [Muricoccus radiodurans]|uniref:MFS transporter n=1 Tax=Muricoccus radiodurans TaxID=2231721 RepID=UPI003CEAF9D5
MSESALNLPAQVLAHERGNVARLVIAQAMAGANATIVYATAGVVGNTLAPDRALATLPVSVFVCGMAACTLPSGYVAGRFGRRASFLLGTLCGGLTGLIACLAVLLGNFWLFCAGTFFGGAYAAVVLSFRFAAAECVSPDRRARAISAVMAGGIAAGVIGPQLVTHTMDLWPPFLFAATYLAQAALAVLCAFVLVGVRLPTPKRSTTGTGRSLAEIAVQPRFIAAVLAGVISYLIMNLIMTSAPLAMRLCGLSQENANLGLQWHVIAMYAPSFVTGRIITRIGAPRVVIIGLILIAAAAAVGLTGITVAHFWVTLVLLGLGWNFGFIGASTMVVEFHRSEEKNKVQSLNDFVVFGLMVLGSFASGGLLNAYGWEMVCWVAIPPLAMAGATLWATGALRVRAAR